MTKKKVRLEKKEERRHAFDKKRERKHDRDQEKKKVNISTKKRKLVFKILSTFFLIPTSVQHEPALQILTRPSVRISVISRSSPYATPTALAGQLI